MYANIVLYYLIKIHSVMVYTHIHIYIYTYMHTYIYIYMIFYYTTLQNVDQIKHI